MSLDVPPPTLDVPDGWRLVSEEVTTPFDVRVVSVTANTRIYEDVYLRERLADLTDADATWRFVFASRLRVSPVNSASRTLSRLVEDRANARFVDVIRDRGFESVERADTHRLQIGEHAADNVDSGHRSHRDTATVEATRYRARVRFDGRTIPVEAYFAAWPAGDGTYLLGGGAYPLSLPGATSFDPENAREELFSMLRSIR